MATATWVGGATLIRQVSTITVANTWAPGDTANVIVNGRTLTVTVASATTAGVAAELVAAINASSKTEGLFLTETRNIGGQEIPEFTDFEATLSGSTVILTSTRDDGQPFTATVSETTAGTGTLAIAATVVPTGPHHADNAKNWLSGALPANDDSWEYLPGAPAMKYGLSYFRTNTLAFHFKRTTDYEEEIGLPATNEAGYPEYRTRFLQLYDAAGAKDITFVAGANGGGGGITRLDGASQSINSLTVIDAGDVDPAQPNIEFAGGTLQLLIVRRGYVLIDPEEASMSGTTIDTFTIGAVALQQTETLVVFGDATVFTAASTLAINGGTVVSNAPLANGGGAITLNQLGGDVEARGGNLDNVNVKAGTFTWSGTGTNASRTIAVFTDATLDLSTASGAKTFGTLNAYGRSIIRAGSYSPTITYLGCSPEQVDVSYYADA